jgi:hypothetical protein
VKKGTTVWYPDCFVITQMVAAFFMSAAGAVGFGIWKLGRSISALANEMSDFCDADSEEPLPAAREIEHTQRELAARA